MSNRTLVEINHDYTPGTDEQLLAWAKSFRMMLGSGNPKLLPSGVTWFATRHHTEPCVAGDPPLGWQNQKPPQEAEYATEAVSDQRFEFTIRKTPRGATATMSSPKGRVQAKRFRDGLASAEYSAITWINQQIASIREYEREAQKPPSIIEIK